MPREERWLLCGSSVSPEPDAARNGPKARDGGGRARAAVMEWRGSAPGNSGAVTEWFVLVLRRKK